MKILIVTAVFTRAEFIAQAVNSVQRQTHTDIEHIVIDGAFTDGVTPSRKSGAIRLPKIAQPEFQFAMV